MILIHGAFCGGWAMANFAHAFEAAGYRTQSPNLRHHEPKPRARDSRALGVTSIRDYTADIRKLIIGLPEKPILVGHSMGGLIAQMLAAQDLAKAIVLLAPSAPWGVLPSHWNEFASGFGLYLNGHYWEQALIPTYEVASELTLNSFSVQERMHTFSQMVPESGRAMFEIFQWWLDVARATEVPAHRLACPVFCAAGGLDTLNPPETVKRIAARYRQQEGFRIYPKMGHWLIGEPGWERVAENTLAWLTSSVNG